MTNEEILQIALAQSAEDMNCKSEDFLKDKNVVTISAENPKARSYIPLPLECDLVSYGNNVVAQVSPRMKSDVKKYIDKYGCVHCFEAPNINALNKKLEKYNYKVCFMAEYFLPDMTKLTALDCEYEIRVLYPEDFSNCYNGKWPNALRKDKKELDILAVGAFDGKKLIGLAGGSADCENMVQIGIDVMEKYRRKGIASALTSRLALEILNSGKVPFYCAAWSNIKSVRNAIKAGFRPA
ncbi:MAG: GNAT family N-acetyltransferase, partial [Acutalibacteraceae bacterium]